MTTETTTSTKYLLERWFEHLNEWHGILAAPPRSSRKEAAEDAQRWFRSRHFKHHIVEIVTTTTVTKRVVE